MAAPRRIVLGSAAIALILSVWVAQQHAQVSSSAARRAPAQRFTAGRPDSALVWGPFQYTCTGEATWNYSPLTLTIPSFDPSKRYFVRISNGDTTSTGLYRVSQASVVIGGKEFLSPSDITAAVPTLNKVIWLKQATSTLVIGVRGPNGNFMKVRIYETQDPSYDIHVTSGDITVPNGLNLIGDMFSRPSNASGPWTVRVVNGEGDGTGACTNVKVTLNGVDVIPLGLVNASNLTVIRQVTLQTNNTITMRLYGTSGYATLYWTATDTLPPELVVIRPTEGYVTDTASVATTATLADQTLPLSMLVHTLPAFNASAGFTVAAPLPVDGLYNFVVTGTDRAGYSTTIARHVIRDTQAPVLDVSWPPVSPLVTTASGVTVTGAWSDTSITTVTVDDVTVGTDSSGTFSLAVPLDLGSNGILFRARDSGGRVKEFKRYVNRAASEPTIPATVNASTVNLQEVTAFRDDIKFLFDPDDPGALQKGPTLVRDSIKVDRAAVVQGLVFSRDLGPLPNVKVRVLGHPEFGETNTREDGRFDFAVNGGQTLTLRLTKAGYLESQRQVEPPPLRYSMINDVAMLGESSRYLPVDVSSDTMLVGRFESDSSGDRRIWVYVPDGANATITPEGSGPLPPLSAYQVRLKEFTVGNSGDEAMPGDLPPSTAYTYCVDMSLREADSLRDIQGPDAMRPKVAFSKPLSSYVRAFLGMPVGTTVPSGYYDPQTAKWVANEDGCVIKIAAITAGEAILETDGVPGTDPEARLELLGIDLTERKRLAKVFAVGDSLWRMRIDHFSSHDFNYNQGSSPGSQTQTVGAATAGEDLSEHPDLTCGCVIENENRVLGESIPIVGTPYALHYRSSRQVGDRTLRWIRIPLTGSTVPTELRRIQVVVDVAGRRYTHEVTGTPIAPIPSNLIWRFEGWNGTDVYGRPVVGSTVATVRVGYEWPTSYAVSTSRGGSFNNAGATAGAVTRGATTDRNLGRIEWRRQTVALGAPSLEIAGLGHWTISPHHQYDPTGLGILYRGDGSTLRGKARFPVIKRFAGNAQSSWDLPSLPQGANTENSALSPSDLVLAPDGTFYFSDGRHLSTAIRRITRDKRVEEYAGAGNGPLVDGGPALGSGGIGSGPDLGLVNSIALESNGDILFATLTGWRVCRVTTAGQIVFVAGTGTQQNPGSPLVEGGPANQQPLGEPTAIAVGPDGSIFIGDYAQHKIYRVATDGTIRTFAGNGLGDYSGNPPGGAPATAMAIVQPSDIAVDPQGRVYVSDEAHGRVFEITPDGFMRQFSPAPDHNPRALAIGPDGSLYIGQTGAFSGVIRRDPTGSFSIIAGTIQNNAWGPGYLTPNFSTDEGAMAAATRLATLNAIAIAPNGDIYTAEAGVIVQGQFIFTPAGIRRIAQEVPGVTASEIYYPDETGNEVYVFNLGGRHLRTVDTKAGIPLVQFGYGADGRLSSIRDALDKQTLIERSAGIATGITAPFLQHTELSMTAAGYLEKVRNPAADTDSMRYSDGDGSLLTHHRSPEGQPQTFDYDSDGRLRRDTDASGGYHELTVVPGSVSDTSRTIERRTALGRTTIYQVKELLGGIHSRVVRLPDLSYRYMTDSASIAAPPFGAEVKREVDPSGASTLTRLARDKRYGMFSAVPASITTSLPSGKLRALEMTRTWGANGVIEETYSIAGDLYRSSYDSLARRLTFTSPMNRTAQIDFDASGRPTTLTRPGVSTTDLSYDPVTKLLSDVTQGGRTWHYAYDPGGRLRLASDPLLREVVNSYDAAGRLLTQDLPGGQSITHTYDRNGRLTSLVPPGRPGHGFHYTPIGLNDRYIPPEVSGIPDPTTHFEFNLDRQLTQVTRPDGGIVDLAYDATSGVLSSITHPRGVTGYTYWTSSQPGVSTAGQLRHVSSADTVTVEYTYDGPLVKSETWSGQVAGSVAHEYDMAFRDSLERVTVGAATDSAGFSYDRDGLLVRAGPMAIHRRASDGQVDSSTVGLITHSVGYDNHGDPVELHYSSNDTALFHQHLERDSLGRVVRSDETWSGATTSRRYEYDTAGRLARVLDGSGAQLRRYEYDDGTPGNGNRTAERGASDELLAPATYDDQDRLLTYGTGEYTYTAAGELLRRARVPDTLWTTYDALGNLAEAGLPGPAILAPGNPQPAPANLIRYYCDGQNRRVKRSINGTPLRGWLYRDGLSIAAELDGSGALLHHFVYGTRDHVPDLMTQQGTAFRLVTDHLGSVRAVVNTVTGEVIERRDYDAWGVPTLESANFQSLGYAGGLSDPDTRLVRFGARDYDPEVGRWTSTDPIGFAGDRSNLYRHVRLQPTSLIDPTGLAIQAPDQLGPLLKGDCRGMVPSHPSNASVKANIFETVRRANPWWFRNQVKNKGPWDYKQQGYEAFGNFNYGATGAAYGFPAWFLLKQAGAAQREAGTSRPEFGASGVPWLPWTGSGSFGDDPEDQYWIMQGILYYQYLMAHGGLSAPEDACGCKE